MNISKARFFTQLWNCEALNFHSAYDHYQCRVVNVPRSGWSLASEIKASHSGLKRQWHCFVNSYERQLWCEAFNESENLFSWETCRSDSLIMEIHLSWLQRFNIERLTFNLHLISSAFISHFSYRLPCLRMGSLERVRYEMWNRHEIPHTIDSEGARERRKTLRVAYTEAGLRGLPLQESARAKSIER